MAVTRFLGKIFYPLIFDLDADAGAGAAAKTLESAVTVTNKGKEANIFLPDAIRCEEMRKGIGGILGGGEPENPSRIARIYSLNRREVFRWPKNNRGLYFCPRSGPRTPVALTGTRFLLFETGVALIEMDFELSGLELEDAMNATYYLCEVKDPANHFEYENRIYDPQTKQSAAEPVSFSLKEWFLQCCSYLPGCRNFEDRELASTISKPLLYGWYWLDQKPEGLPFANIAQNYKASYKGVEDETLHQLQVFENSWWCASYNGAVNVSHAVDDPSTNRFFETAFAHKWESEYLFLFVNTVHQKYAVLNYLAQLGELACTGYDYPRMRELLIRGEVMRERCGLLKNRCFFDLPSHVEHVNRVYRFFQSRLDIPACLTALNGGVDCSIQVSNSYVCRVKEIDDLEEELRGARNERNVALITASIACLTFFNTAYEAVQNLFLGNFAQVGLGGLVVAGTFLATITGVVFNVTHQRSVIRDLREKLDFLKSKSNFL